MLSTIPGARYNLMSLRDITTVSLLFERLYIESECPTVIQNFHKPPRQTQLYLHIRE
jgi:hypothetical protein